MSATPGDRRLRRERAPTGDDNDIGLRVAKLAGDSWSNRILVAQDSLGAGHVDAAQEDVAVLRLDRPRAMRNRVRRVDHLEIDSRMRSNPIEERRAVRGRLGRDDRHPQRIVHAKPPTSPAPEQAHSVTEEPSAHEHANRRFTHLLVAAMQPLECSEQARARPGPPLSSEPRGHSRGPRRARLALCRAPAQHVRSPSSPPAAERTAEHRFVEATPAQGAPASRRAALADSLRRQERRVASTGRSPRSPEKPGRSGVRTDREPGDRRAPSGGRTGS